MTNQVLTVAISEADKVNFLRAAIDDTQGKFFSMVNVKSNNQLREWKGVRTGVAKHANGGVNTTAHIDHYVTVFEPNNGGQYRTIDLRTVKLIKTKTQHIAFA